MDVDQRKHVFNSVCLLVGHRRSSLGTKPMCISRPSRLLLTYTLMFVVRQWAFFPDRVHGCAR